MTFIDTLWFAIGFAVSVYFFKTTTIVTVELLSAAGMVFCGAAVVGWLFFVEKD